MPIRRPSICLQGGGPGEDVCSPRLGATVRPLIAVRNGSARPSKTTRRTRGFEIVAEYYDAAVAGADPVETRPGFAAMLQRIAANGVRTIIVETANRFARDLMVQEVGYAMLRKLGIPRLPPTAHTPFKTIDRPGSLSARCSVPLLSLRRP